MVNTALRRREATETLRFALRSEAFVAARVPWMDLAEGERHLEHSAEWRRRCGFATDDPEHFERRDVFDARKAAVEIGQIDDGEAIARTARLTREHREG